MNLSPDTLRFVEVVRVIKPFCLIDEESYEHV